MLIGVAAGMGVAALIPSLRSAFRVGEELQGTLLAALVITAVGMIDDIVALSAPAKIAGQVLAAGLLILTGVELLFFWFPFGQGVIVVGSDLAVPLTVAWVVLMVNAVNLLDGLDGLAAGSALAITYINGRLLVSGILAAAFLLMVATVVPARLRERAQARRARELAAQGSSSTSPAAMPGRSS